MLTPKPLDVASELLRLDGLMASLRREAKGADADFFEEALVDAAMGADEVIKAESAALDDLRKRIVRLARG